MSNTTAADLIVIGAGPGGYAAAFYASSLGKEVILIEQAELGGVCLNRGCIPSKALIHATEVLTEAKHASAWGMNFESIKIDLNQLRTWKNSIVEKLQSGIAQLAQKRKVTVISGRAYFEDAKTIRVETEKGQHFYTFNHCIIATGSSPMLPAAFDLGNKRIMTSTEALETEDIPEKLLIVGGGYIGMELGGVYAALGSEVTVVEAGPQLLAGADPDLARPVITQAKKQFQSIQTNTKVQSMATAGKKIKVTIESDKGEIKHSLFDKVLVSIGRRPNSDDIGLENAEIEIDERGYIKVNESQETNIKTIYAIGDIAGGILLAHKASKEARIAVDAICANYPQNGKELLIPAVVFTNPELAWVGLTETEAKKQGRAIKISKFPWAALGRALSLDRTDGLTKLIIDPETHHILGVGIVGVGAGELIAEGTLAIEMGATVEDIAHVIHPHPTVSESILEAAEAFYGHSAHIYTEK